MKKIFTVSLFLLSVLSISFAQNRYTEEVFTDEEISVTSDVHFATNATILPILFAGASEFLPEDLFLDVYEPDQGIDTETDRPVVIVVHGGDALPMIANNACWGDKLDSVTVTTARKLARMGYVAIAPNYRLGWNPLATEQDAFLDGLVDAGVRVQQDLKAYARYLRKTIAEDDNPYQIHPDKIAIWGTASTAGTYTGFAAYINEIEETQTATWFVTDSLGNIRNTFDLDQAGDLDGTTVGMLPNGDTTNYVNWPGYSSRFQLAALGSSISLDEGTIDADEPPMIQFGNPNSVVTQFPVGPIQLPTTGQVVAFVQLSQGMIKEAVDVGLNDAWINAGLNDEYTLAQQADPNFGDTEGWLPLYGHPDNEYPWVHWDTVNCPVSMQSFDVLPEADREYAISQIDTMAAYFGPRACITLGLNCTGLMTNTREVVLNDNVLNMAPNPTTGTLRLEANFGRTIQEVGIFSMDGKLMDLYPVDNPVFKKDDLDLRPGFYIVTARFEDGVVSKKLIITQ